jgi:hypothetical protein
VRLRLLAPFVVFFAATSFLPATRATQRAVADPLTLFAKMMPVLSHDRCVNCHGATNPYTGDFHPGEVSRNAQCQKCHTAHPRWDIAPPVMAFFKKTTRQLCNHFEMLGPGESVAIHLEHDEFIGLAFTGRRGNAVEKQYAQPPPMSRADFVRAYRTWVRDGGGICSTWQGTITRTESIATDTTPGSGPNSRNIMRMGETKVFSWQNGTHTYTINIKDGVARVATTHDGELNHKSVTRSGNCEAITHVRVAYALVSSQPPTEDAVLGAAGPLVATGEGSVRVGLAADGSYRIHIVPPRETTQKTTTTTTTTTCGSIPQVPPGTDTSDWSEWVFEIVGNLPDPKNRRHLKGQSVIDADSSYDPSFGLAYHADVARLDGSPFKFRITTTWDLSRVP